MRFPDERTVGRCSFSRKATASRLRRKRSRRPRPRGRRQAATAGWRASHGKSDAGSRMASDALLPRARVDGRRAGGGQVGSWRAAWSSVLAEERIRSTASSLESPPTSVSQTSGSIPSAARMARTRRWIARAGSRAQRLERLLDPADRASLAQQERRRVGRRFEREAQRGPQLGFVVEQLATEPSVTSSSRAPGPAAGRRRAASPPRSRDRWRPAAPAGWGSSGRRCVRRDLCALGGLLDRRRDALGQQLARRGQQRRTRACLLPRPALELVCA